ncbi:MAG: hypothetical protein A2X34_09715 [Elusimicrobia bacterium GWC2_51_8]|nr:MAG: hypothetical protein A2X33_10165 [Elusimicrobia bacterium GWA2_51_34]OGR61141.1 MAG: hypothetical protein A2X34_09715 [Elusimicrobia bacterium GWC2_51_8]OGR84727.1 MAG: hypothetical protein A2021_03880 [Elusimicrobia bacterium GWF2_52_66]
MRNEMYDKLRVNSSGSGPMLAEALETAIKMFVNLVLQECASHQKPRPDAMGIPKAPASDKAMAFGDAHSHRRLINIGDLSKYLGTPKSSIYTMVCLKKIPEKAIVRLGRSLRFDLAEIDSWIEQNRATIS